MKKLFLVSFTASNTHACLHNPQRKHSECSIVKTPRPLQTFALQYLSFMCSSYSSLKYLIVVRTGLGALLPSPQSEPSTTFLPRSLRSSISPSLPCPEVILLRIASIWNVPILHGGHFPHDSDCVNERKNFATSTMQVSSSITTIPPEPIMEPTETSESKSTGRSRCSAGMHPPDGPPVCTALNFLSPIIPPPMSKIIF